MVMSRSSERASQRSEERNEGTDGLAWSCQSTSSTETRCVTVWTMPRISGRFSLTTVSWTRLSPSDRMVWRWLSLDPISDRVWVTLRRAMSDPPERPRPEHAGRGHVLQRQAATARDLLRADQGLQRGDRGVHDVDRVVRAERLGQHVVDAGALQHGAHRTTGDDTGTGARRLEQHDAGRGLALHRVRDRALDERHLEEVLLGLLDALGDRRGHLLGLAVTDPDGAVAVAHHDQRGEAEPAAALDDLGHAVDRDDPLDVRGLLRRSAPAAAVPAVPAVPAAGAAASALLPWHQASFPLVCITVRTPARRRGPRRRAPRSGRGTCRRRGRRPP